MEAGEKTAHVKLEYNIESNVNPTLTLSGIITEQ